MKARLRLTVEKKADRPSGWVPSSVHFSTLPRPREEALAEVEEDCGEYAALGIHADPREAARMALRGLIDWLEAAKGLTRVEGYMLASVAAHLKMAEVVDMPNYAISCTLPLSAFTA